MELDSGTHSPSERLGRASAGQILGRDDVPRFRGLSPALVEAARDVAHFAHSGNAGLSLLRGSSIYRAALFSNDCDHNHAALPLDQIGFASRFASNHVDQRRADSALDVGAWKLVLAGSAPDVLFARGRVAKGRAPRLLLGSGN